MNLSFEPLQARHALSAARLALADYQRERASTPDLPALTQEVFLRNLMPLMDNGNGVAALDGGELVGFLTGEGPFVPRYGPMQGVFSPMHGHGFGGAERGKLASLLYAQAARRWMERGISGHAIALYAHDQELLSSFFYNGFGGRTVDGIVRLGPPEATETPGAWGGVRLAPFEEAAWAYPLEEALAQHMAQSPCYMRPRPHKSLEAYVNQSRAEGVRTYGAFDGAQLVGFCAVCGEGETLVCDAPGYAHVCAGYMKPEYRGGGRMAALLRGVFAWERALGTRYLGVDYESLNPTAQHFWPKRFAPYTCGVVRRQDERML
ncbi:MAG: GNAT family N-acetyltransferase [Christensenellales bacterium]|jgi:GNAT superfamily N-acetyltransferase